MHPLRRFSGCVLSVTNAPAFFLKHSVNARSSSGEPPTACSIVERASLTARAPSSSAYIVIEPRNASSEISIFSREARDSPAQGWFWSRYVIVVLYVSAGTLGR